MGLWNFFGGNKIGPGHPRYDRELKKHNESLKLEFELISIYIMGYGMPGALKYEKEEDIISVLKKFPSCPKFPNGINQKWVWGARKDDIENWRQAQQWLKEKENPAPKSIEYTKELEQKIKDQEERIQKLEKQNSHEKE